MPITVIANKILANNQSDNNISLPTLFKSFIYLLFYFFCDCLKPVLFLFVLCFLAAIKNLFNKYFLLKTRFGSEFSRFLIINYINNHQICFKKDKKKYVLRPKIPPKQHKSPALRSIYCLFKTKIHLLKLPAPRLIE